MQDLLNLILKNITTQPEAVVVDDQQEDGKIVFNVTVAPDDMGRVIGKNGKVIQAIRSIMHVAAIRNDVRVRVNVVEVEGDNESEVSEEPLTSDDVNESSAPVDNPQPVNNPQPADQPAPSTQTENKAAQDDPASTPEPQPESDIDLISGAIDLSESQNNNTQ